MVRLILVVLAFFVPAMAQAEGPTFEGPHIEAVAGYDRTDVAPGLGANNGIIYGIAGGYDWRSGALVIGPEVELNDSSVSRTTGAVERSVGRSFYAGARTGFVVADPLLLYIKGGYASGRFDARGGPASYTGDGFRIGAGGEYAVTQRQFVRAEYRYSDYGREARGQTWVIAIGTRF
jgi:outer membrane immunogenic protein